MLEANLGRGFGAATLKRPGSPIANGPVHMGAPALPPPPLSRASTTPPSTPPPPPPPPSSK
ncbi:hypothetical protein TIFTF001_001036 [Ficus carica]|uniref:Uncharacterized protein n=1 Tax=Ficus carica TaxID=3494 RepID=A0AA88CL78_FICCA|nr:hypothetical protein TIFTF001_001036 [Ficus carica]